MSRTIRGKVAVVGLGETRYYKRGQSPDAEFKLALKAIIAACKDAGISPKKVDGFASFSNDRSDPSRLAAALGCGAVVAVVVPALLQMLRQRLRQEWPSASSCFERWRRGSLDDLARDLVAIRLPVRVPIPYPTA